MATIEAADLFQLVTYCDSTQLLNNGFSWLRRAQTLLRDKDVAKVMCAANSLGQLLRFSALQPEMSRSISQEFITPLVEQIISMLQHDSIYRQRAALRLVRACACHYASAVGPYRGKLETSLSHLLATAATSTSTSSLLLTCVAYLPRLGNSSGRAQRWTEMQTRLIAALATCVRRLLDGAPSQCALSLIEERADEISTSCWTKVSAQNLCKALAVQLRSRADLPLRVQVRVSDVLMLCAELLQLRTKPYEEATKTRQLLTLHRAAWQLLEALADVCSTDLVAYSDQVGILVFVILGWDCAGESAHLRPFRVAAWNGLAQWCRAVGSCGAMAALTAPREGVKWFLRHAVADILFDGGGTSVVSTCQQVNSKDGGCAAPNRKHRVERKRRAAAAANSNTNAFFTEQKKVDRAALIDLTRAALDATTQMHLACGTLMHFSLTQQPQLKESHPLTQLLSAVSVVATALLASGAQAATPPYHAPAVLFAFFKLLRAFVAQPPVGLALPLDLWLLLGQRFALTKSCAGSDLMICASSLVEEIRTVMVRWRTVPYQQVGLRTLTVLQSGDDADATADCSVDSECEDMIDATTFTSNTAVSLVQCKSPEKGHIISMEQVEQEEECGSSSSNDCSQEPASAATVADESEQNVSLQAMLNDFHPD